MFRRISYFEEFMRTRVCLCLALLLGAPILPRAFAQEPGPPPDLTIRSTTRVVVLDAIVTDNKSEPVGGLASSDFTILEDGKPQKISFFSYESPTQTKTATPPPPLRPGVFTNDPQYHASAGPLVIILMDGLNTPVEQGLAVRQQIVKYLTNLKVSNSGAAVLALGNDLTVLQDFTTDPGLLLAAAGKYTQGRTAADVQSGNIEIPVTTGPGGTNTGPVSLSSGTSSADTAASAAPGTKPENSFAELAGMQARFSKMVSNQEQDVRVRATLGALRTIGRAVSGYPGRKALLWFSASFPFSLSLDNSDDLSLYKSYRDELHQVAVMLSDANVAVYPIDARSLFTNSMMDSRTESPQNTPNTSLAKETFSKFNTEITMDKVAQDTGGLVFRNTNDLNSALQSAIKDSQSYYTIGYYPEHKNWDGKFHTIKVVVANKDVKVRNRSGYYAVDPSNWKKGSGGDEKQVIAPTLHTLAATGVIFYSHLVPPEKKGGDTIVEILVDMNSITFGSGFVTVQSGESAKPGIGGQSSSGDLSTREPARSVDLQFEVAAFSPDGKLEHIEGRTAQADLREATYQQLMKAGKFGMKVEMPLKAGLYLVRVGVRDNRTGRLGTVDMPLKLDE
jgi:VWFA-related protein